MEKLKYFLTLIRIHQLPKNFFVLIPLVFSKKFLELDFIFHALLMFLAFIILSGMIYIINDINDIEEDKLHPKKQKRPLPSGKITINEAKSYFVLLAVILSIISLRIYFVEPYVLLVMIAYLINNILYSKFLKKIAVVDLLSVSFGFVLRTLSGALIIDENLSVFLLIEVILVTLIIISIKRYRELKLYGQNARKVLSQYSINKLKIAIQILGISFIIVYSIFSVYDEKSNLWLVISNVPIIFLCINFISQAFKNTKNKEDDPLKLFLSNNINKSLIILWTFIIFISLSQN